MPTHPLSVDDLLVLAHDLERWTFTRWGWNDTARLWSIDGSGRARRLATGDPYRMVSTAAVPPGAVALGLTVEGWAAAADPDGTMVDRPSRHPDRRRLRIVAVVGGAPEVVSVLRFADDATVIDQRETTGGLALAMCGLWLSRPAGTFRS